PNGAPFVECPARMQPVLDRGALADAGEDLLRGVDLRLRKAPDSSGLEVVLELRAGQTPCVEPLVTDAKLAFGDLVEREPHDRRRLLVVCAGLASPKVPRSELERGHDLLGRPDRRRLVPRKSDVEDVVLRLSQLREASEHRVEVYLGGCRVLLEERRKD